VTAPTPSIDRREPGPGVLWQIIGFAGGMTVYALHLFVGLVLVPVSCGLDATWPIHLATALSVAGIVGAGAVALWVRRSARRAPPEIRQRRLILGTSGLFLNALALAIVILSDVPSQVLNPCLP
jgi:hypothetical protein